MKHTIFLFFILCFLSAETNNYSTPTLPQIDKQAKFIKEGETFTAPFNGYFFNTDSTKRLLENDTLAPSLLAENKVLNLQIETYKDINESYKMQISIFKEYGLMQKRDRFKESLEKTVLIAGGWLVGVLSTLTIYYVVDKTSE